MKFIPFTRFLVNLIRKHDFKLKVSIVNNGLKRLWITCSCLSLTSKQTKSYRKSRFLYITNTYWRDDDVIINTSFVYITFFWWKCIIRKKQTEHPQSLELKKIHTDYILSTIKTQWPVKYFMGLLIAFPRTSPLFRTTSFSLW